VDCQSSGPPRASTIPGPRIESCEFRASVEIRTRWKRHFLSPADCAAATLVCCTALRELPPSSVEIGRDLLYHSVAIINVSVLILAEFLGKRSFVLPILENTKYTIWPRGGAQHQHEQSNQFEILSHFSNINISMLQG